MKKILSTVLVGTMLLSSSFLPALAYETAVPISAPVVTSSSTAMDENALKNILVKVKTLIDIPERFVNFDYYLNQYSGTERWNLNWTTADGGEYISVTADGEGYVLSYYYGGQSMQGAPKIFKKDALDSAQKFIAKIAPYTTGHIRFDSSGSSGSQYSFGFIRIENGVEYANDSININLNYITGEVTSFWITWDRTLVFPGTEGIISESDAEKIWKDKASMKLVYQIKREYDPAARKYSDNPRAYLMWVNQSSYLNIDAKTGESVDSYVNWEANSATGTAGADKGATAEEDSSSIVFSPEELEKIENYSQYITYEKADQIVRSIADLSIDDTFRLSSYTLSLSKYESGNPTWRLSYTGPVVKEEYSTENIYAVVDAVTGKLISYNYYNNYYSKNIKDLKLKYSKEQSSQIAIRFLEAQIPEYLNSSRLSNSYELLYYRDVYDINGDGKIDSDDGSSYVPYGTAYEFVRIQENVDVVGNYINVSVDETNGKIVSFQYNWTTGVDFEAKQINYDEKAAIDRYYETADKSLVYNLYTTYLYDVENDSKKSVSTSAAKPGYYYDGNIPREYVVKLNYTFSQYCAGISATTGEALDYNYNTYVKYTTDTRTEYSDIGAHWAKDKIQLLYDANVLLLSDEFHPDEAITQKEFLAILYNAYNRYPVYYALSEISSDSYSRIVSSFNNYGIIPVSDQIGEDFPVSRVEAVKYMVNAIGYGEIAKYSSIYRCDYLDAAEIQEENIGYVAIAQALNIASGSNGYFNPNRSLTKAEAAILIYNFMDRNR